MTTTDTKARIAADRIQAMKDRNTDRKALLDYILGQVQKIEKDTPAGEGTAPDAIALNVITAYIKSLRTYLDQHGDATPEQSTKYRWEIAELTAYLPAQLTDDDIRAEIAAQVTAGNTKKGLVLKALKEKHGAALDGKRANELATEAGLA